MLRFLLLILLLAVTALPVFAQTNLPTDLPVITPENASRLVEVGRYGDGLFEAALAWSPNGKMLAVAGSSGLWLFPAVDFSEPEHLLRQEEEIFDVTWSPDSKLLAVGTRTQIIIWSVAAQEIVATFNEAGRVIAFSADSKLIVASTSMWYLDDYWEGVTILDSVTGEKLATMPAAPQSRMMDVEFSPDGKWIAAISSINGGGGCYQDSDQGLHVWDLAQALSLQNLEHDQKVFTRLADGFDVSFNEHSSEIITGIFQSVGGIGFIPIENKSTPNFIYAEAEGITKHFPYHDPLVALVTERFEDSEGYFYTLRLLDRITGTQVDMQEISQASPVVFSPDGTQLASVQEGILQVWSIDEFTLSASQTYTVPEASQTVLKNLNKDGIQVAFSDPIYFDWVYLDGDQKRASYNHALTFLAYVTDTYGWTDIGLWDEQQNAGQVLMAGTMNGNFRDFFFSDDDRYLAFVEYDWQGCGFGERYALHLWDTTNGIGDATEVNSIDTIQILDLAFSPSSTLLAVAEEYYGIMLLDSEIGQELITLQGNGESSGKIAFSEDGRLLVAEGIDGVVRIWGIVPQ